MRKLSSKSNSVVQASYVGFPGELTIDPDTLVVSVHDGLTAGGIVVNPTQPNQTLDTTSDVQFASANITGNLYVAGNVNFSGNIVQISGNSGQFFGDAYGIGAIYIGIPSGYAVVANPVLQSAANVNDYVQNQFQNLSSGTTASTDWVATANNGSDLTNYIDMGIAGGAWDGTQSNSLGTALKPNDGYLYVQGGTGGGNLIIGTTSVGKTLKVVSGGPTSSNIVAQFNAVNTISSTTTTGAVVVTGGLGVSGNVTAGNSFVTNSTANVLNIKEVKEAFNTKTGATGTVIHDCSTGHIFYHSSIAANFTANLTNLNLDTNYATTVTLVLIQGATAYIPNALQIGGVSQTINWQGGSAPAGNANKNDVVAFSILNNAGTYKVLGQLVSFG